MRTLFRISFSTRTTGHPVPTLKHFIQRVRVLSLWRDILRALRRVDNPLKCELRSYAREEIERNRHIEDLTQIRYLISTGRKEFETVERYKLLR